jgi:hypothetical protein
MEVRVVREKMMMMKMKKRKSRMSSASLDDSANVQGLKV